ncbi:hypothetical protein PG999_007722 [Apiospora kogelbergensis]|uniref:Uncharacterized protein n=1 Tax=Apiospora kogelbergensis TaxID=1337665 RepID=A0AAW0QVM1_9PEZI
MFPSSPYNSQRSLFSPPPPPRKQRHQRPPQSPSSSSSPSQPEPQPPLSFHGAVPSRQNDAASSRFSTPAGVASLFATLRLAPHPPASVPVAAPHARSPYATGQLLAGRAADASRTDQAAPRPRLATARARPGYAPLDPRAALGLGVGDAARGRRGGARRRFAQLQELRARRREERERARAGRMRAWEEQQEEEQRRLREERRRDKVGGRQRVAFASDSVLGTDIETGAPVPYAPRAETRRGEPVVVGYPGWGYEEVMGEEKGGWPCEEAGEEGQPAASYV